MSELPKNWFVAVTTAPDFGKAILKLEREGNWLYDFILAPDHKSVNIVYYTEADGRKSPIHVYNGARFGKGQLVEALNMVEKNAARIGHTIWKIWDFDEFDLIVTRKAVS